MELLWRETCKDYYGQWNTAWYTVVRWRADSDMSTTNMSFQSYCTSPAEGAQPINHQWLALSQMTFDDRQEVQNTKQIQKHKSQNHAPTLVKGSVWNCNLAQMCSPANDLTKMDFQYEHRKHTIYLHDGRLYVVYQWRAWHIQRWI